MDEKRLKKRILFFTVTFVIFLMSFVTALNYIQSKTSHKEQIKIYKQDKINEYKSILAQSTLENVKYFEMIEKNEQFKQNDRIQHRVNQAFKIAHDIYDQNKDKTDNEIKRLIKTTLNSFNWNKNHIWIIDKNRNSILKNKNSNSNQVSFEKNLNLYGWIIGSSETINDLNNNIKNYILVGMESFNLNNELCRTIIDEKGLIVYHNELPKNFQLKSIKTTDGKDILEHIMEAVNSSDGFGSFSKTKPSTGKLTKKIIHTQEIDVWGWTVITGLYVDIIDDEIEKQTNKFEAELGKSLNYFLILTIIATIISILLTLWLLKLLENIFTKYKNTINKQHQQHEKQEIQLQQKAKQAQMGEMISVIAHQWKQPLNTIKIIAQKDEINEMVGETTNHKDNYKKIQDQIDFMSDTMDEFRLFFSPNKLKEVVSLSNVMNKTFKLLDQQFKQGKIETSLEIEPNLDMVSVYPNELQQVVLNILKNGIDIFKEREIENPYLEITLHKDNKNQVITITDNAGGIPDEYIEKIFDPYFSSKGEKEGTGIGLNLSRVIVEEKHNGKITAKNKSTEQGKGASFIIEIPTE